MTLLENQLSLGRCPHCQVDRPNLHRVWNTHTTDHAGQNGRNWSAYACGRCGGVVIAAAPDGTMRVSELYPVSDSVDESIPQKAKDYLTHALNSLHAPPGAVMLAASAVDAMLKEKGYKDGNLYSRINKAAKDHLITDGMAKWAHQVRLEANDQRHADEEAQLPNESDARQVIAFATALAEFLFVLPSRVTSGLEETKES